MSFEDRVRTELQGSLLAITPAASVEELRRAGDRRRRTRQAVAGGIGVAAVAVVAVVALSTGSSRSTLVQPTGPTPPAAQTTSPAPTPGASGDPGPGGVAELQAWNDLVHRHPGVEYTDLFDNPAGGWGSFAVGDVVYLEKYDGQTFTTFAQGRGPGTITLLQLVAITGHTVPDVLASAGTRTSVLTSSNDELSSPGRLGADTFTGCGGGSCSTTQTTVLVDGAVYDGAFTSQYCATDCVNTQPLTETWRWDAASVRFVHDTGKDCTQSGGPRVIEGTALSGTRLSYQSTHVHCGGPDDGFVEATGATMRADVAPSARIELLDDHGNLPTRSATLADLATQLDGHRGDLQLEVHFSAGGQIDSLTEQYHP